MIIETLDGLLDSRSNETGEEKGAERIDVEGDEILGDGRRGGAGSIGDKGGGGVP